MKIIKLSQGCEALVDDKDFEMLNKFKWFYSPRGKYCHYATKTKKIKGSRKCINTYMHRLIMGLERGDNKQVDHINGNGLDNRKGNLRFCTTSQNFQNTQNFNNKNGYKGVVFHKKTGKYTARIWKNYKRYSLKYHKTPQEAAIAYNDKAKELFKTFAFLNIIKEKINDL